MPRQAGTIIENLWNRGLITEATGLNFPEHAATDADNVKFLPKGTVERRRGIDLEGSAETLTYDESEGVIKEFVWSAVAKNGGFTFLVLQKGAEVHFFELQTGDSLSAGVHPTSLSLNDFKAPGASAIENVPCSFASGAGYLYIAHPSIDPVIVRYNVDDEEFEAGKIIIRIRDFDGLEDDLNIIENPDTLSDAHHYNLKNQGWDQQVRVGNVTNDLGPGGQNSPGISNNPIIFETLS